MLHSGQKNHKVFYKVVVKQLVMYNSGINTHVDSVGNTQCLEKYDDIIAKKLANINNVRIC